MADELVLEKELAQLTPVELDGLIHTQRTIGHNLPYSSSMGPKGFEILADALRKIYSPGDAMARVLAAKGKR